MNKPRAYPPALFFILASSFFFFFSLQFLTTPMPLYIKELGGGPAQIGVAMGLFSFASLLCRPLVGRLVDSVGRKSIMLGGSLIFVVGPILYITTRSVSTLCLARMLHGIGMAAFTTANMTLVADIARPARRAELLGLSGMTPFLALMVAPTLGASLLPMTGFPLLFAITASIAALSLLIALPLRETGEHSAAKNATAGFRRTLVQRPIWVPCLLSGAIGVCQGANITFLPLYGLERNIANVGPFFTACGMAIVLSLMPLGRLADRIGHARVIIPATLLIVLAISSLSITSSLWPLLIVASVYGLGFGGSSAALNALLVNAAAPEARGTAVSILTASMDIGVTLGSTALGPIAVAFGYGGMYLTAGVVPLIGLAIFLAFRKK